MFRSRIIEDQTYYQLRRKQLLFLLLPIIPTGLLANFFELPEWLGILLIVGYIIAIVLMFKNQKLLEQTAGDRWLEIDRSTIKVKRKNGEVVEQFGYAEVEEISLQHGQDLPQDSFQAASEELFGEPRKDWIAFRLREGNKRFHFEVDSHYNLAQLADLKSYWQAEGYLREANVS